MDFLKRPRTILALVLIAIVLIVAAQNSYPISLFFLFWRMQVDAPILYSLIFLLGVVTGVLGWWGFRRGRA